MEGCHTTLACRDNEIVGIVLPDPDSADDVVRAEGQEDITYRPPSLSAFEQGRVIGKGISAVVYEYSCPKTSQLLAVKILRFTSPPRPTERYYPGEASISLQGEHASLPSSPSGLSGV